MAKNNERKNTATLTRTSAFREDRKNYLNPNGGYTYWRWDDELKREIPVNLTPGENGVTKEWIIFLDSIDHGEDLADRYATENTDYGFLNRKALENKDGSEYELATDAMELLEAPNADPLKLLIAESEEIKTDVRKLMDAMQSLTPAQVDLIYTLYGEQRRATDIAREEGVTEAAIRNRRNKILKRLKKIMEQI